MLKHISNLKKFTPNVLTQQLQKYNVDWLNKYKGNASVVVQPTNTLQVSQILSYCNTHSIAVVPQAGNTSLVGGSIAYNDELVISVEKLNKIHSFSNATVTCDSGVVLENLDHYCQSKGFIVPLDLGAKGSCMIGGNVATNAGGLRFLRYGSLKQNVLGMEVVLADGRILNLGGSLRKDNTGYDLKQLFIGSEGTLGIITKVTMQLANKPKHVSVSLLGLDTYRQVIDTFHRVKSNISDILSAFEYFDRSCMKDTLSHASFRNPFSEMHNYYVLIETHGFHAENDTQRVEETLGEIVELELANDVLVAQDQTQSSYFWNIRERIPEAVMTQGTHRGKYDVSLPLEYIDELGRETEKRLPEAKVFCFGHIGDGNLHLNVSSENSSVDQRMDEWLWDWIHARGGSISAEHGVGVMKKDVVGRLKGDAMNICNDIKHVLDPKGILNPGKVV